LIYPRPHRTHHPFLLLPAATHIKASHVPRIISKCPTLRFPPSPFRPRP
jgi:hypothetical protein